jgi:serine/threonine protein kinase
MSPELRFKQAATTKSDIFAFGIIFWEVVFRCINGYYQEPYSEYPRLFACKEAIHRAVAEENTRPTIPSTCPNAVAQLIRCCWAAEPTNRPSAEGLVKLLEQVQREYALNGDVRVCVCVVRV